MSSVSIRNATPADFPAVLKLQQENHKSNVNDEERQRWGFVSYKSDEAELERALNETALVVAEHEGKVVGFEFGWSVPHLLDLPLLVELVDNYKKTDFEFEGRKLIDYRLVVEGQIIVDRAHRGTGLAKRLHDEFRERLRGRFDVLVAEVSPHNPRSLNFHTQVAGMTRVNQYHLDGMNWVVLAQRIS